MKEKFAGSFGFEVRTIAMAVGGDVKRVEPSFAVFDFAVGVGEVASARAQGFNFGTREDDSGFDRFGDGEVVTGFPVLDFDRFQGAEPRCLGRRYDDFLARVLRADFSGVSLDGPPRTS